MATQGFGTAPVLSDEERQVQRQVLEQKADSAAKWFYWVAALSLVNVVLAIAGGSMRFIFGMGITEVVTFYGQGGGGIGTVMALIVNVFIAGVCAMFGFLGSKKHAWAFWVGMLLYLGDAGISLLYGLYLGVAFHAFVLFCLFQGPRALKELKALEAMGPPVVTAKPIA